MSTLPVTQKIYAGAAQLLVGNAPTKATAGITTKINHAGTAYTLLTTSLIVDSAATIAPDVWETTSTIPIGDPIVMDAICSVSTGEVMWCWKRTTGSNTIFVERGCGKYWTKYGYSQTQYASAASVVDNADLELLGTFTLPSRNNLVVTNGDVVLTGTQAFFQTQDNYKGFDTAYTSEPAKGELTCKLPRNTLPETMRTLGLQGITDGATPAKYFSEPGRCPAGSELPKKLFIIIPNSVLNDLPYITVGGANHLDLSDCIILPKGQITLDYTNTFANGSQKEMDAKIECSFDDVMQKGCQQGITAGMAIASEIIA
jgi:hypothetical protein